MTLVADHRLCQASQPLLGAAGKQGLREEVFHLGSGATSPVLFDTSHIVGRKKVLWGPRQTTLAVANGQ